MCACCLHKWSFACAPTTCATQYPSGHGPVQVCRPGTGNPCLKTMSCISSFRTSMWLEEQVTTLTWKAFHKSIEHDSCAHTQTSRPLRYMLCCFMPELLHCILRGTSTGAEWSKHRQLLTYHCISLKSLFCDLCWLLVGFQVQFKYKTFHGIRLGCLRDCLFSVVAVCPI